MAAVWKPEEDNKLRTLAKQGLKPKQVFDKNIFPERNRQSIAHRFGVLRITQNPQRKWSDEDIWTAWFLNRKGLSTREIANRLGRSKQATSSKLSNERLYFAPPREPLPEHLEIEVNGETYNMMEIDVTEVEKQTGRI